MKNKILFTILLMVFVSLAKAQSVYDTYLDFNASILKNKQTEALALGEKILASAEKLPSKTQTNFYFKLAKVYEEVSQPENAIIYYEKVNQAEPDYYVAHRALGYLYLSQSNAIGVKLNASVHNATAYNTYLVQYRAVIKKSLTHLEKAQACDPDDQSMTYIKQLYNNLKDTNELKTLNARLKEMSGNCVSLLTDE